MTIFSVVGGERAVTVRYVPVVAWGFAVLTAYGVAQIIGRMAAGLTPVAPGPLMSLALLIGLAGFILYSGGQLVVADFDRAADAVVVRRYGLAGFSRDERRLSEVRGLDIRILRRAQHRLELRFASGERLPLTSYYTVTFNQRGLRRLSALLGVEPTIVQQAGGR